MHPVGCYEAKPIISSPNLIGARWRFQVINENGRDSSCLRILGTAFADQTHARLTLVPYLILLSSLRPHRHSAAWSMPSGTDLQVRLIDIVPDVNGAPPVNLAQRNRCASPRGACAIAARSTVQGVLPRDSETGRAIIVPLVVALVPLAAMVVLVYRLRWFRKPRPDSSWIIDDEGVVPLNYSENGAGPGTAVAAEDSQSESQIPEAESATIPGTPGTHSPPTEEVAESPPNINNIPPADAEVTLDGEPTTLANLVEEVRALRVQVMLLEAERRPSYEHQNASDEEEVPPEYRSTRSASTVYGRYSRM
ncbi:hypothetical protein C8J57DRAFT_1309001 [Mycena rebaudengoi]|nr:hypothetical protein C8J57DRAFT_1309001 [Mycena rebaudengoi]